MKAEITDKCTGHGRCYALAPDVFDEDDDGFGVVKPQPESPSFDDQLRLAARGCPEGAIQLVDD